MYLSVAWNRIVTSSICLCLLVVIANSAVSAQEGIPTRAPKTEDRDRIDLHLKESDVSAPKHIDAGFFGLYSAPTSDTKQEYGGGFVLDYTGFGPLVPRLDFRLSTWKIDVAQLDGARFLSFVGELDMLYQYQGDAVKPYAGVGLAFYSHTAKANQVTGLVEDSLGQTHTDQSFSGGTGLAPTLVAGLKLRLTARAKVDLRLGYMFSRPSADVSWQAPCWCENEADELRYDRNVASLMIGMVWTQ